MQRPLNLEEQVEENFAEGREQWRARNWDIDHGEEARERGRRDIALAALLPRRPPPVARDFGGVFGANAQMRERAAAARRAQQVAIDQWQEEFDEVVARNPGILQARDRVLAARGNFPDMLFDRHMQIMQEEQNIGARPMSMPTWRWKSMSG